jgi:hypothetical protein
MIPLFAAAVTAVLAAAAATAVTVGVLAAVAVAAADAVTVLTASAMADVDRSLKGLRTDWNSPKKAADDATAMV